MGERRGGGGGVSTSYPTSAQVRPWLVHSRKLGVDAVLQTAPFWVVAVPAALPSLAQQICFLHVTERHCLDRSFAFRANKRQECSSHLTGQQPTCTPTKCYWTIIKKYIFFFYSCKR